MPIKLDRAASADYPNFRRFAPYAEDLPTLYLAVRPECRKIVNTLVVAKSSGTVDRARWEHAALTAFERGGPAAVTVVGLARELGVTKGSFYWHFETRGELLDSALARWERNFTTETIDRLREIADPRERLVTLIRQSIEGDWSTLFARLLVAAPDEPAVASAVARSTKARLQFLETTYVELGMAPAAAKRHALLAYSSYIGIATLTPSGIRPFSDDAARNAYADHMIEVLVDNTGADA